MPASKSNYQKNKIYRDRWNANNPMKFRELCKKNQRKYDAWKRIQKTFLNILKINLIFLLKKMKTFRKN